jgi:uncharacterized protein (DUF849 family)
MDATDAIRQAVARPDDARGSAMLQACLNGERTKAFHRAVPCTPEELAADARAVVAAGAEELHLHPRDADGRETLDADAVAAALRAVRAAVPGVPVGISTRWAIPPGGRARQAPMHAWTVQPDYVSVNLAEADAPEVMGLMLEQGIGVEAGLATVADARRFAALPERDRCLRVLVEIEEQDEATARAVAAAIVEVLDIAGIGLPRLLHGFEASVWPLHRDALARGLDTRIGLEDGSLLPTGERAAGNVALVRAARAMA